MYKSSNNSKPPSRFEMAASSTTLASSYIPGWDFFVRNTLCGGYAHQEECWRLIGSFLLSFRLRSVFWHSDWKNRLTSFIAHPEDGSAINWATNATHNANLL